MDPLNTITEVVESVGDHEMRILSGVLVLDGAARMGHQASGE